MIATATVAVLLCLNSFCFVALADEADMKSALSLSGSSLKGSTLSIEVRRQKVNKADSSSFRGGFTSPRGRGRGGGFQTGSNRGDLA